MKPEFIVVRCQIVGNPEIGYSSAYYWDMKRLPSVEQGIAHGCVELGHDDFLIGKVEGNRLVSLQWMDEVRDDRQEVIEAASQLCLEPPAADSNDAPQAAARLRAIRAAHDEYEAALARREHGAVAADHFIRAVAAQLERTV